MFLIQQMRRCDEKPPSHETMDEPARTAQGQCTRQVEGRDKLDQPPQLLKRFVPLKSGTYNGKLLEKRVNGNRRRTGATLSKWTLQTWHYLFLPRVALGSP